MEGLGSESKGSYNGAELRELGVSFQHSIGEDFPDFKPISEREYRKYQIDSADLAEHIRTHYDGFDEAFYYTPQYPLAESNLTYEKAFQNYRYLEILHG